MTHDVIPIFRRLPRDAQKHHLRALDCEVRARQRELMVLMTGIKRTARNAACGWKYSAAPLSAAEFLERIAGVLREIHALGEQRRALFRGEEHE